MASSALWEVALSPRDLPVWARGVTAAFLLLAAWYVPRAESLVAIVGYSALDISAGVVAVSILLGLRLPVDLWPMQPRRQHFAVLNALWLPLAMGVLIVVSGPSGGPAALVESDRGAAFVLVVGTVVWALAMGRVRQRPFARWFGLAAACALAPGLVGAVAVSISRGGVPPFDLAAFAQVAAFFLVLGSAGALVTQEIGFRRVLIGQAGDAGLATVLIAALAYGLWNGLAPDPVGGVGPTVVATTVHGVVLGSLYSLSRSLLVPALYHGVSTAGLRAFDVAAELGEFAPPIEGSMWVILTSGVVAVYLGFQVSRRSGFLGILHRRQLPDAAHD